MTAREDDVSQVLLIRILISSDWIWLPTFVFISNVECPGLACAHLGPLTAVV